MLTMGNTGYRYKQPAAVSMPKTVQAESNLNPGVVSGAGIQSWSGMQSSERYFIFAVQNIHKGAAFKAWALANGVGFKELVGRYKGVTEQSFICNWKHKDELVPWYAGEESLLVLGALFTSSGELLGARPAYKYWLTEALTNCVTSLGFFKETTREYALAQDAYTYDPSTNTYFICKERNKA